MGVEDEGRASTNRSARALVRPTPENASAKPRGKARKRNRRSRVIESDDEETVAAAEPAGSEEPPQKEASPAPAAAPPPPAPRTPSPPPPPLTTSTFDMEADISKLEPATFTTINRGPPEPMLRLSWDHKVNLMAEKVLNPLIYMCEKCDCPVLSYGRMIPCKHVLCYDCAKTQEKCWRCGDRAVRVERAGLCKLFMCLHDGKRYDTNGCRRTYLSQRDLQAHINHRHRRAPAAPRTPPPPPPPPPAPEPRRPLEEKPVQDRRDPRAGDNRGPHSFPSPSAGGHSPHGSLGPRAAAFKSSPRGGGGSRGSSPHGGGSVGSSPLGQGGPDRHGGGHGGGHGGHGHGGGGGHRGHGSGQGSRGSGGGSGQNSRGSGQNSRGSGGGGGHGSHGSGHGSGHHGGFSSKSAPPPKQQQIPVISSQRSGNLITIPIQGQEPAPEPPPPPPPVQPQYPSYAAPPATTVGYPAHGASGYGQPPEPAPYYQSTPPPPPQSGGYGRTFPPPQVPPPNVRPAPQQYPPQPSQPPAWPPNQPPPLGRYYR